MNHLKLPLDKKNTKDIYLECIETYKCNDKKNKLRTFVSDIESNEMNYKLKIPRNINKFYNNSLSEAQKELLINVYKEKMVKGVGRRYYDEIMSQAEGVCPICGVGPVSELDHYLPKSEYPLLAVEKNNLIPICHYCNKNKGAYIGKTANGMLLHTYFENLRFKWIEMKIIFFDDESIEIKCFNKYNVEIDMKKRLDKQIEIYKLSETYRCQALTEFNSIKYRYKKMQLETESKNIQDDLKDVKKSAEHIDINSWKSALYRALEKQFDDYMEWLKKLSI